MTSLDEAFVLSVVAGTLRAAVPLLLAGLGQIIYERSGVLNLGVEGFLLVGALAAIVAQAAGLPWYVSLACGGAAAALATAIHAMICVFLSTNQAVTGLAMLFLLQGVTALWGRNFVGVPLTGLQGLTFADVLPGRFLGSLVASMDFLVPLSVLCAFLVAVLLKYSRAGIRLRACGENAEALRSSGVRPDLLRLKAGVTAGVFYGLAGGYLGLFTAQQWQENMTAGRGWIALVLVIVARWNPLYLLIAALLFGGINALQLNLQITGLSVSRYFLAASPYLITIIVLGLTSLGASRGLFSAPAELGKPLKGH